MPKPEPFVGPSDRPVDLPLDASAQVLADCVERIKPVRIRHSARNAFEHLRMAWRLHPIDSEMSLFRAITAEEEAATALILALRQQKYLGAERLNHRDHTHKSAIWPLLRAIGHGLNKKGVPAPNISISKTGDPKISLSINIGELSGSEKPIWATPDQPFNFVMHSDENGPFELHRWEQELLSIAAESGFSRISDHIKAEANLRNHILYASNDGIPTLNFPDSTIIHRVERVKAILVVTIGVMQTNEKRLFVSQALEGLLRAIDRFSGKGFSFPDFNSFRNREHVTLIQQPGGEMKLGISKPLSEWVIKPYYPQLKPPIKPRASSVQFDLTPYGIDQHDKSAT